MRVAQLLRVVAAPSATVAVLYFAIGACGGASAPSGPPPPPLPAGPHVPPATVTIAAATSEDVPVTVDLPAQLVPRNVGTASASGSGTVSTLVVQMSDAVRHGQTVATIRMDRGRTATVVAPIDGVVIAVPVHVGDHVDAHAPVATVGDLGGLVVQVAVPSSQSMLVHPGQPCDLAVASMPDRRFAVVVARIAPVADAHGDVPVEANVDNADGMLRAGSPATLRIQVGVHPGAVTVPTDAVIMRDGRQCVVLATGRLAVVRPVRLGGSASAGRMEILGGVSVGDDVVVAPGDLANGSQIQAR